MCEIQNIYEVYDICENYNPDICSGKCEGKAEKCFVNMFELDEDSLDKLLKNEEENEIDT